MNPSIVSRRFDRYDAIVLLAAVIGGAIVDVVYFRLRRAAWPETVSDPQPPFEILCNIGFIIWALTFAVVVLGLVRSRTRLKVAYRAPGVLACLAVVLSSTLLVFERAHRLNRPGQAFRSKQDVLVYWVSLLVGFGAPVHLKPILVAWTILILSGRWRMRRDWPDRLGLALSAWWILAEILLIGSWYFH